MGKYCDECGKELHKGSHFCGKCGAAVKSNKTLMPKQADSDISEPRPSKTAPPESDPKQKPISATSAIKSRQSAHKRVKHSKGKGGNRLCIALVMLLMVQIVLVALFGWPGFFIDYGTDESKTFTLKKGQTVVELESGVKVNFGPYNLMDGEKVTITEMPADADSVQEGIRTVYDVTAGERNKFDGLITITLPYDESKTDASDEEGSVFAEYYNKQNNVWEPVEYTVNAKNNTVTITTDHLSDYCTVTVQDASCPYALLYKFSGRTLDDESALAILQEFEKTGQPGDVGDSFLRVFYSQLLPEEYVGNEEAELVNDVLGWLTDVSELAASGGGYKKAAEVLQNSGYMLLGLSAVSLGGTMYDAYKGDESAETVAAQAYKLAYNTALAWADFKRITAGALQVSMLGVISIDYSLNKFMIAANQTYKDALFKTVIAYNEEIHPRTDAEWYAMILKLYQNHSDNPKRFNQGLDGLLYNFSERYFRDNPEEQRVARNEAGINAYTTDILPETEDAKQYCIEQYVARLGQKLQPVIEDVFRRIRYDSQKGFRGTTNELRQALNAPLTLEILEEIADGEKSKYAGTIVVLSRPGGKINNSWTTILNDEGCATIDATILGYIQAGVPTQLRLWNKGDNHYEDDPALTQEFTVTEKFTSIVLKDTEIDAKWFEGNWRHLKTNTIIHIKIINDSECSYTAKADGKEIITYTTHVFNRDTSSLKMAYSSNNDTKGLITLPETEFFGYEENNIDYISSKSGKNVYQRIK